MNLDGRAHGFKIIFQVEATRAAADFPHLLLQCRQVCVYPVTGTIYTDRHFLTFALSSFDGLADGDPPISMLCRPVVGE